MNFNEPAKILSFQSGYLFEVTNVIPYGAIDGTQ